MKLYLSLKEETKNQIYGLVLIFISFILLFCLLIPAFSGQVGGKINAGLKYLLGYSSFFLPAVLFIVGYFRLKSLDLGKQSQKGLGALFFILSSDMLFESFRLVTELSVLPVHFSGKIGRVLAGRFLFANFGLAGVILVPVLLFIIALVFLADFSIISFTGKFTAFIIAAYISGRKKYREKMDAWKTASAEKRKARPAEKVKRKTAEDTPEQEFGKFYDNKPAKEEAPREKKPASIKKKQDLPEEEEAGEDYSLYKIPATDLLELPRKVASEVLEKDMQETADLLIENLKTFNCPCTFKNKNPGPVITRYDIMPNPGIRISSITSREDDIALAIKAKSIRIIAPIPGEDAIGIEIPNKHPEIVTFREVAEHESFRKAESKLSIALGKTTDGKPYITDLAPMPHLLVAGSTGSGKSVCLHSIILSILMKAGPDDVQFLLIDPKMLELPVYEGIPHLMKEVVTKSKHAASLLKMLITVMEKRYEKFAKHGVRDIRGYNERAKAKNFQKENYIVVIIDELADLMVVSQKEVEENIMRLAQLARAVGIHLVLATQRPSVDVITGTIKANLPSRIAFKVLSNTDSRVILDTNGAENLLGRGDMLYKITTEPAPIRLQGCFVSEKDVRQVVDFIKSQGYQQKDGFAAFIPETGGKDMSPEDAAKSIQNAELLNRAVKFVAERRKVSYELLKANGFSGPKATNVISLLEMNGYIRKPEGKREWELDMELIEKHLSGIQE